MYTTLPLPNFLQINGYLRCRLTKNSPRRTSSTPAGVFCTLLASTPSICKKDYYKEQTVNLPRLFAKRPVTFGKQHNFFTNNQLSHKTRKKIFRFIYQNVLFGLGQFNPINKINSLHIGTHVVSKGVSPLAAREKEGVIGGEKNLL